MEKIAAIVSAKQLKHKMKFGSTPMPTHRLTVSLFVGIGECAVKLTQPC